MNAFAQYFVLVDAMALLLLPRRWAPVPLIVGACWMTLGQGLELGPFHFRVLRMLVAIGALRVIVRREVVAGGMNGLDRLMVLWALWALFSSAFHEPPASALVLRLGLIYDVCGIYFLLRIFCSSVDDIVRLSRATALVLAPVALAMLYEHAALYNVFSIFGGVPAAPYIREGRIRAFGPFASSITAGTVGAVSLPLMIGMWQYHRLTACIGALACLVMIVTSASSGPVMSALFAVGALLMWRCRRHRWLFPWIAVCGYIAIDLVMKAPAYYLIAHVDVVGGSTGWHRARLIETSLEHLGEWWFAGTDYTRHWMAYGIDWSPDHIDITNHYLKMGVMGGLPLLLGLIAIMAKAFSIIGKGLTDDEHTLPRQRFVLWALGSALTSHAAAGISISYFDQSFLFLYLTLAAIGSAGLQRAAQHSYELSPGRSTLRPADPGAHGHFRQPRSY